MNLRRYTKASGAAESEVEIVGVNYTMTTSATLSGITAVGRCRLTVSKPVLKAPLVSVFVTIIS